MPTRVSENSALFKKGEKCVPELSWWTGDYAHPSGFNRLWSEADVSYYKPNFKSPERNFWLRKESPFCIDPNGMLTRDVLVACPKAVLDEFFSPKANEWGEIAP